MRQPVWRILLSGNTSCAPVWTGIGRVRSGERFAETGWPMGLAGTGTGRRPFVAEQFAFRRTDHCGADGGILSFVRKGQGQSASFGRPTLHTGQHADRPAPRKMRGFRRICDLSPQIISRHRCDSLQQPPCGFATQTSWKERLRIGWHARSVATGVVFPWPEVSTRGVFVGHARDRPASLPQSTRGAQIDRWHRRRQTSVCAAQD